MFALPDLPLHTIPARQAQWELLTHVFHHSIRHSMARSSRVWCSWMSFHCLGRCVLPLGTAEENCNPTAARWLATSQPPRAPTVRLPQLVNSSLCIPCLPYLPHTLLLGHPLCPSSMHHPCPVAPPCCSVLTLGDGLLVAPTLALVRPMCPWRRLLGALLAGACGGEGRFMSQMPDTMGSEFLLHHALWHRVCHCRWKQPTTLRKSPTPPLC